MVGGALLWCRHPLVSSDTFTQGHLISGVIAVESPGRAERAILGDFMLLGVCLSNLEHICGG